MEIYITGDTHGDIQHLQPDIFYEQESLTKADITLLYEQIIKLKP